MKSIDINYRSAEKFFQDYLQLKTGKLFLPADEPKPVKTQLVLNVTVPRIDYAFQLNGIVLKIRDKKTAAQYEKKPGMLVHIQGEQDEFFQKLDQQLLVDEKYQFLLALCETVKDPSCIIGEDIDEARTTALKMSEQGIPAVEVAKVVHRALTANRPRTRYLVGKDAKIAARMAWLLPDRAMDWMIKKLRGH